MSPNSAAFWRYWRLESVEAVRAKIQECEGRHVQQVCYSTYMDALTQICFTEQAVRSTIDWRGAESWTPGVEHG